MNTGSNTNTGIPYQFCISGRGRRQFYMKHIHRAPENRAFLPHPPWPGEGSRQSRKKAAEPVPVPESRFSDIDDLPLENILLAAIAAEVFGDFSYKMLCACCFCLHTRNHCPSRGTTAIIDILSGSPLLFTFSVSFCS